MFQIVKHNFHKFSDILWKINIQISVHTTVYHTSIVTTDLKIWYLSHIPGVHLCLQYVCSCKTRNFLKTDPYKDLLFWVKNTRKNRNLARFHCWIYLPRWILLLIIPLVGFNMKWKKSKTMAPYWKQLLFNLTPPPFFFFLHLCGQTCVHIVNSSGFSSHTH